MRAVAEDSSGYPDCRSEYYRVFQQLVREGTRPEIYIEIMTPVIGMRKWEFVKRGMELGRRWTERGPATSLRMRRAAHAISAGRGPVLLPKRGSAILSPIGPELRDNNEPRG